MGVNDGAARPRWKHLARESSLDWGGPVEDDPRLTDYVNLVRRRWRWAFGVFVVVVVGALVFTLTREPEFRAEAEVIVRNATNESLFPSGPAEGSLVQREPSAELQYTSSDSFVAAADDAAGFESDVDVEIKEIDPDERVPGSSGVLVFTARADTKEKAVVAADAYADTYVTLRHTEDVAAVDDMVDDAESAVATVTTERETLREPLDEVDAEIALATEPAALATLLARRVELEASLRADLARADLDLNRVLEDLAETEDLAELVANPASAARVNVAAEPAGSPTAAALRRNAVLAVVVGAVLGIGAALLRESLDTNVQDADLVQRRLGAPLLGAVPVLSNPDDRETIQESDAEAFKSIRTSLRFAGKDGSPLSVIGMTSSAPYEGKTLCSVNLASSLATDRGPVLLIDADLRRPSVHKRVGLHNVRGLSDVLSGVATPEEATQSSGAADLDVITAGPILSNASELIGSIEFIQMIKDVSAHYESIVVDCPPVLAVADARMIGNAVEAMVLVVAAGSTSLSEAERSTELLRTAGAHIAGFIFNKADERAGSHYGYRYTRAYTDAQ